VSLIASRSLAILSSTVREVSAIARSFLLRFSEVGARSLLYGRECA